MTTTKNKLILRDAGGPAFECRSFNRPLEIRELKKDGYIGTLVGYAIIFESESRDMGGWREIITRGAPSASLKKADVRLLYQHDKTKVMARQSAGNLRLTEDEIGVRFEADLIDTTVNRDAYAEIKAGNVDAMSFGAPKATFKSSFEKRSDGTKIRRVSSFEVQEISVVSWAAYEDTALAAREFAEFVANEQKDVEPVGVDVAIARGRQELMELRYNQNHDNKGQFSSGSGGGSSSADLVAKAKKASDDAAAANSLARMKPKLWTLKAKAITAHKAAEAAHLAAGNTAQANYHKHAAGLHQVGIDALEAAAKANRSKNNRGVDLDLEERAFGSSMESDQKKTVAYAEHRSDVAHEASAVCVGCESLSLEDQRQLHRTAASNHSDAASSHYRAARLASTPEIQAHHRGEAAKHETLAQSHYSKSY